jgi:hypothetical protein
MPNFESPLSSRKFASQPMRDIEVPDETGYTQQAPNRGAQQGQISPSVTRRYGTPMSEQDMLEFQDRVNSIADPESHLSDMERDFKRSREDKLRSQTHLNEGARRRIEMLIGMTRLTREFTIEQNTYVLQTLKGKEMREAILAAAEFDGTVQSPFEIRRQMLARSLCKVANVPIEQFVGSPSLQARFDFVDELDDSLLNRLMEEYSLLTREAKAKFAITTAEQVSEVADDLKK